MKLASCRITTIKNFKTKEDSINNEISRLYKTYYESDSLAKILSRPEMNYKDLPNRNDVI